MRILSGVLVLRHSRESCYQLHGKPLNVFGKGNGGRGRNQGYKPHANLANIDEKPLDINANKEGELNREDIEKLKQFLSWFEKSGGITCFSWTHKYSLVINVLKEQVLSP